MQTNKKDSLIREVKPDTGEAQIDREEIRKQVKNTLGLDEFPFSVNPEQVAKLLNISRGASYELFNCKTFPAIKIGKKWVCVTFALAAWLNEQIEFKKTA